MAERIIEWFIAAIPLLIALPFFLQWSARLPQQEKGLVGVAIVVHVLAAFTMVLVTREVYGYGDMLKYHRLGVMLAGYVRRDATYLPEVLNLIAQRESTFDYLDGAGTATGTMHGLSALFALALFDSLPAACVAVALLATTSKLALYSVFRERVHPGYRRVLFVAIVLIPSFVFWSSGLLKEGFAVGGLGWLVWALAPFIGLGGRRRPARVLIVIPAALVVGFTKPYLFFPLALAASSAWFVGRRTAAGIVAYSPLRLVAAICAAVLLMGALSALFPRYATEVVVEQASALRDIGTTHRGGSTIDPIGPADESVAAHAIYAPFAVATVLFRPFLFEVRNPMMLVSSIEMTVFLFLFLRALRRGGIGGSVSLVMRDPTLAFCAVFVLIFATAVGLSSTNLGTLARYRSPMLPFFGLLLFALVYARSSAQSSVRLRIAERKR